MVNESPCGCIIKCDEYGNRAAYEKICEDDRLALARRNPVARWLATWLGETPRASRQLLAGKIRVPAELESDLQACPVPE